MYYQDVYEPRLSDYNAAGRLSMEAILQLMENTGGHHMAAVRDTLVSNGVAWILADWRVAIARRPRQFQRVHVSTFVHGKAPASTICRDFRVTDDEGGEFLRASAKFALVDMNEHKLTRISEALLASYGPEPDAVFSDDAPRLRAPETFDDEQSVVLRRSDMDYNGHVHNTRYIAFALEALPEELYRQDDLTGVRIVYRAAVRPGSRPVIRRAAVEGGQFFRIEAEGQTCTLILLETGSGTET